MIFTPFSFEIWWTSQCSHPSGWFNVPHAWGTLNHFGRNFKIKIVRRLNVTKTSNNFEITKDILNLSSEFDFGSFDLVYSNCWEKIKNMFNVPHPPLSRMEMQQVPWLITVWNVPRNVLKTDVSILLTLDCPVKASIN